MMKPVLLLISAALLCTLLAVQARAAPAQASLLSQTNLPPPSHLF